jgi:hypothetical protein
VNKISESGAKILTGQGLSDTRERIERAFEAARGQGPTGRVKQPADACSKAQDALSTKQSDVYTDHRFIAETNRILDQAMQLPLPQVRLHKEHSYYVGDLNQQPLASDLFAAASRLAQGSAKVLKGKKA